ncbi:uncharacterized protein LOC117330830 [Pecten maximus]|uniref:uncharacterized protein LOC117330830 n=1 Tax=Pecten maximus TaxID=6579 RepID=UPI0014588A39|nr:uncharacterized protein LOC117330830 [Pecten maximus]
MAAPIDDCRVCGEILTKKQRRTVFGDTFGVFDQLSQVLSYVAKPNDGLSRFVCGFCFNKLNKLHKIDYDLMHKLDALRSEKITIISALKEKLKNARQIQKPPVTPVRSHKKRVMLHSPTPRKTKKALFKTPTKTRTTPDMTSISTSDTPKQMVMVHASGSTAIADNMPESRVKLKTSFSPNKVKVMFRTKKDSKIRAKVVQDGKSKQIIKNIAMHNSKDRTAKIIMESTLKEAVTKRVLKEIRNEITKLTSTLNMSVLRRNDSKSLGTFKFANLNTEIKIWAPFFHECISTIVKDSAIGTAVVSAISLKFHNKHMTAFQHVISQILDHSGATDETISILNKLGMCVSTSAMTRTKKELVERQLVHTKALMMEEKEELEAPSVHLSKILQDKVSDRPGYSSKFEKHHWTRRYPGS